MSFWVYLLHCADGTYYVGHTDDLELRIAQHLGGAGCNYTQERQPVKLVWAQAFPSRDEALNKERQVKGWSRRKKEALIRMDWRGVSKLARGKDRRPRSG